MSTTIVQGIQACCDGRGLNSVRLRRLFTLLAQDLFSDDSEHGEYREQLACLKYNLNNPVDNNLYIGPTHTAGSAASDASAGVYVDVKEMILDKKFLGNRLGVSPDGATKLLVKPARALMQVRCKHPDVDVTLMMAESLFVYYTALQELFVAYVPGLLTYDVVEMTAVSQDRPRPESRFSADVLVRVGYQLVVAVTEESHKLKKFGFDVRVTGA